MSPKVRELAFLFGVVLLGESENERGQYLDVCPGCHRACFLAYHRLTEGSMADEKKCPQRGSDLVQKIASSEHCNQCGATFNAQKMPTPIVERKWPSPFLGEKES
jgi:hypothetical protein